MKTLAQFLVLVAAGTVAFASANDRTSDYDYDTPVPGSYSLPVIKPAADGSLLNPAGKPVRLAEFTRGRITVMSFIYTRCAAARACPYATGVLMQLPSPTPLAPSGVNGERDSVCSITGVGTSVLVGTR